MLQSTSVDRPLLSAYDGQTLGPGDTYDATGYPVFQKYNGTNSSMATAAFTAGTLIDGMDCMIAVRRDSAAADAVCWTLQQINRRLLRCSGHFSGSAIPTYGGCGTPSIFVNDVAVSNTGGALYDATGASGTLLSTEGLTCQRGRTDVAFGNFGGGTAIDGARGDILLYPSTASTEDKDAARQYLADYYGVTLP
jgi:hypothetical protein